MPEQKIRPLHLVYHFCSRKMNQRAKRFLGIMLIAIGLAIVVISGISTYQARKSRTVNLRMENIGELSTQVAYYTNVQVIRNGRTLFNVAVPFTQNQYIYSYDGIIKAGIDFSKLTAVANEIDKTITVTMPHAFITSNEVDENSLEIYDESRNIFTPLKLKDIQSSRELMKEEASQTAIGNGILEEAEANARQLIECFLKTDPAHEEYTILFVEE